MEREPTPVIRLSTTDGDIELHHYNCLVRIFQGETYNHLEHFTDEDKILGMRVGKAVLDIFFENDFSYRYDKYPDEATVEWFIKSEMTLMESEIEELE